MVASRSESALSLSRRRVRGELAELTLEDLRPDPMSIRAVLACDGDVDDDVVDAVARSSSGWAAAVRLATVRFEPRTHRSGVIDPVAEVRHELWHLGTSHVHGRSGSWAAPIHSR